MRYVHDVMQYINQRFAVCYGTDLVSILFFCFIFILLIFELSQSSELCIFLFDQRHGYRELESMVRCTFLFCFVLFFVFFFSNMGGGLGSICEINFFNSFFVYLFISSFDVAGRSLFPYIQ